MRNILITLVVLVFSAGYANAGVVKVLNAGTIDTVQSLPADSNGTVLIKFSPGVSGCTSGVYTDSNDPGNKEAVSIAIAAFVSNKEVTIYGNTDESWPGQQPAGTICHIYTIRFGS